MKQLTPHVELFLTASVLESDFLFQLTCYPLFLVMFIMDVIIFYHRTIKKRKESESETASHHVTCLTSCGVRQQIICNIYFGSLNSHPAQAHNVIINC